LKKPNVSYLKVFGCKCFVLNTREVLGKFNSKVFEGIFVGYSSNSKAYRIFNRSTLTIEESMNVKFEESNKFVKNVVDVEINSLGEDLEKTTLKEVPIREAFEDEGPSKNNKKGYLQKQVQLLSKYWKYVSSHPKELIIGEVSKGVSTRFNAHNLCDFVAFISHIEPKNIHEAEVDSYWLLASKRSSINLSVTKYEDLFLNSKINQLLVLSGCLETSWMSQVPLLETRID